MMTLPSSSQLIGVVRAELPETLDGISDDPRIVNTLSMVDFMLATIAARCEHEIGWMIEEIEQIDAVAAEIVDSGHDRDARVSEGLRRLRAGDVQSFDIEAVRARYHLASAVLSDCVEIALAAGGEMRNRVEAVLSARLAHEEQIRGALALVGRG